MIPLEALQMALLEEEKAIALYEKFATEHPSLKDIFASLILQEQQHKKVLEARINQLKK